MAGSGRPDDVRRRIISDSNQTADVDISDEEMLARLQSRDKASLKLLLERYSRMVLGIGRPDPARPRRGGGTGSGSVPLHFPASGSF